MIPSILIPAGIAVTKVQPQGAIWTENAAHLPKYAHQILYVFPGAGLPAKLAGSAIVPKIEIGRRSNAALNAVFGHRRQLIHGVAAHNGRASDEAPARFLCPHPPVIKVRISRVKVITMPPAMVSIPLERWEGS